MFDGETYEAEHDLDRLKSCYERVFRIMSDGQWRTLDQIKQTVLYFWKQNYSESSISARLRDFRKEKFGGHEVNRRARGERSRGLFEYQLKIRNRNI